MSAARAVAFDPSSAWRFVVGSAKRRARVRKPEWCIVRLIANTPLYTGCGTWKGVQPGELLPLAVRSDAICPLCVTAWARRADFPPVALALHLASTTTNKE